MTIDLEGNSAWIINKTIFASYGPWHMIDIIGAGILVIHIYNFRIMPISL